MYYRLTVHEGDKTIFTRDGDPWILISEAVQHLNNDFGNMAAIHSHPHSNEPEVNEDSGGIKPILTMTKIDTPPFIRFKHHDELDILSEIDAPKGDPVFYHVLKSHKIAVDSCLKTLEESQRLWRKDK